MLLNRLTSGMLQDHAVGPGTQTGRATFMREWSPVCPITAKLYCKGFALYVGCQSALLEHEAGSLRVLKYRPSRGAYVLVGLRSRRRSHADFLLRPADVGSVQVLLLVSRARTILIALVSCY
jgi:hypothetical protein